MSTRNHRAVLAIAIGGLIGVWLLAPMLAAAHTIRVAYRCEPSGQVTFFAATYHGDPGVFGSIIVDGTPYVFTGKTAPLPGDVAPSQIVCPGSPEPVVWQTVTVAGLANGLHSITTTATSAIEDPWPGCFPASLDIQCASDSDTDGDGVPDDQDNCPNTPAGEVVNASGCSIRQECPCENEWKNHGAYVLCVADTSEDFVAAGLITEAQKDAMISEAGQSSCGTKQ